MNRLFIIFLTVIYFNTGNINADLNSDFYDKVEKFLKDKSGTLIYVCKEKKERNTIYTNITRVKDNGRNYTEEIKEQTYGTLGEPDDDKLVNLIKKNLLFEPKYWEFINTQLTYKDGKEGITNSDCEHPIIIAKKWNFIITNDLLNKIKKSVVGIDSEFKKTPFFEKNQNFKVDELVRSYRKDYDIIFKKNYDKNSKGKKEEFIKFAEVKKLNLANEYERISPLINFFDDLTETYNLIKRCEEEDESFSNKNCNFQDERSLKGNNIKKLIENSLPLPDAGRKNESIIIPIFEVIKLASPNLKNRHTIKISNINEQIIEAEKSIQAREDQNKKDKEKENAENIKKKNVNELLVSFNLNNFTPYSEIENKYLILKDKISSLTNSDVNLDINFLEETLNKISSLEDEVSEMIDNIKEEEAQNKLDNFRKDKTYKEYGDERKIKDQEDEFITYIYLLSKLSLSDETNDLNSRKKITEDQLELINTIEEDKNVSDKEILKNLKELENRNTEIANLEDSLARSKRNLIILIILFIFSMSGLGYYIYRLRTLGEHKLKNSFNSQFKDLRNKYDSLIIDYNSVNNELSTFKNSKVKNEKKEYKDRFQDNNENDVIEEKINPITELLQAYEKTLIDPNRIDLFKDIYDGIGLDRQSRIISQSDTILIKDSKDFALSNFWLVKVENDLILLPGRTLKVNVSSLVADNARYARDLLSGIFKYSLSNEFRLNQYGIIQLHGDHYIVKDPGRIDLPKT